MQFFSAAAGLCLASMAVAAPSALDTRQGPTVVGTVNASLAALVPTLPEYEAAISKFYLVL